MRLTLFQPQTYVQDLLRREGDVVCRQIMQENGHIYVCGDCTMAEDVYQTLKSIVQEIGNFSDSEVESYMLSLRVRTQLISTTLALNETGVKAFVLIWHFP